MDRLCVPFINHEDEQVFVNPDTVMYVRAHQCNRETDDRCKTDLVMVNGSTVRVTDEPRSAAEKLFMRIRGLSMSNA